MLFDIIIYSQTSSRVLDGFQRGGSRSKEGLFSCRFWRNAHSRPGCPHSDFASHNERGQPVRHNFCTVGQQECRARTGVGRGEVIPADCAPTVNNKQRKIFSLVPLVSERLKQASCDR
ncbi:hypothetical protein PBY51_017106 [Eleginops maclovinus]|uniref:Uncharacterized protein n=1 Tax=Eleginops maclovinus TaxID=56733 RepID=A0AAN7XIC8_ELEMC|nr:hypothetical protein PBY51_017106 [Eleginops maclovinus]